MSEYIHRLLEKEILEATRYFSVITLTGPRQSGKSTLLKNLFPNALYRSLEDPDNRKLAVNDPRGFLKSDTDELIIDEVQKLPELLSYIQGIVDEKKNIKFYLSGSSNFALLKNVSQTLAGRTALFELLPFALEEIETLIKDKETDNLLYSGFYPVIWTGENVPKFYYPNYVKTYLERDLRDLIGIKDLDTYQRFLTLTAARIGSIFKDSELSNELGISANTVKAWLSTLQASYVVFNLKPFFTNTKKRLIKSLKVYFTDSGIASWLLDIDSPSQMNIDKMRGHLFENMIICNVQKYFLNEGKQPAIYFYRDSNGNEVDLLIKNKEKYDLVEIKSSETFNTEFLKGIMSFEKEFPDLTGRKYIIYNGEDKGEINGVKILNYQSFFFKSYNF
ncbi:MAG: ATP-binding protein [Muribaculaceae bacterium]|nr:ATP-binding protein [Muribaculaceae bacterium]